MYGVGNTDVHWCFLFSIVYVIISCLKYGITFPFDCFRFRSFREERIKKLLPGLRTLLFVTVPQIISITESIV